MNGYARICPRCNLCVMREDGTCYVCEPKKSRDPDIAHPNDDPNAWRGE